MRLVAELRRAYRHAAGLFRIEPALRMSWLGPAIDVMEQQLKEKYDRSRVRAATVLLRLAGMHRTLRME